MDDQSQPHGWGSHGFAISMVPVPPRENPAIDDIYEKSIFISLHYEYTENYQKKYQILYNRVWSKLELWDDDFLTAMNTVLAMRELIATGKYEGLRGR